MRIISIFLALLFSLTLQANELELVKEFVQMDFEGKRLSSESYGSIAKLTEWNEESGWDEVTIVSSYKFTKTDKGVSVTFIEHGSCPSNVLTQGKENTVLFKVSTENGKQAISSPMFAPKVSADLLCQNNKQCCISSM